MVSENSDYYVLLPLITKVLGKRAERLSRGFSSRLFQELREKRGLVYSVHAGLTDASPKVLSVMAGLGKWQAEEAHELILGQMSDLATNLISEEELRRNKVKAVNKLKMALDSTGSRFNMLLEATLEDTLCPNYWQSSIDDILDVTAEDIRTIARRVVAAPKTLGLIGK